MRRHYFPAVRTFLWAVVFITLNPFPYAQSQEPATSINDESPFTGGVFDSGRRPADSSHSAEQPDHPEVISNGSGLTNQLIVLLNLDDPAILGAITGGSGVAQNRAQAEARVIEAVNSGRESARSFFQGATHARYLIQSDRLSPEVRASLGDDNPEETLHRYIILSYPSIEQARAAQEELEHTPGVEDVDIDRSIRFMPGASGSSIVAYPESPEAYEPFRVEFEIARRASLANESVNIHVSHENMTFEYLGVVGGAGFIPAAVTMDATIEGIPPGTYSVSVAQRAERGDVHGGEDSVELVIQKTSPTTTAYTLFHPELNHYFVTASPHERDMAINNYGWHSADEGFNVWYPSNQSAPVTARPVCRFYSEEMQSRYWTADQEECDALKEPDSGWNYQGIAFQALVPTAGACPTGTDSVWRLYNGRREQNDSNYRFVTSNETYRTMVADGWVGEGVVFCSPPDPEK